MCRSLKSPLEESAGLTAATGGASTPGYRGLPTNKKGGSRLEEPPFLLITAWWARMDSNQRSMTQPVYSRSPLAAWVLTRGPIR